MIVSEALYTKLSAQNVKVWMNIHEQYGAYMYMFRRVSEENFWFGF